MAHANFDAALTLVLRHEGGYADHPADPGGATSLGVTRATLARWRQRPVSKAEVRALTRNEAAAIYRAFYWDEVWGDDLPPGLDFVMFDHAVNSGPGRAVRTLQNVLGLTADGRIGAVTFAALTACPPVTLIRECCRRRLSFLEGLRNFSVFGRGWKRRVIGTEAAALDMARRINGPGFAFNPPERRVTEAAGYGPG